MKKLVPISALFGVVALIVLLIVGSVQAGPLSQEIEPEPEPEPGLPGEAEPEPGAGEAGEAEPEPEAGETAEAEPQGTATRIDFELSDDSARAGTYVVQETGGRIVASWYALDGWRDSGWMGEIDISYDAVYVQVLYYPGPEFDPFVTAPEGEPVVMRILNPAGGTEYGWLGHGIAHALEVEFPDDAANAATAASKQPVAEAVPTTDTLPAGEQVHVVQAGNNLFRIGVQYGCSVEELVVHNGIANPDIIHVGQEIRIPANCVG